MTRFFVLSMYLSVFIVALNANALVYKTDASAVTVNSLTEQQSNWSANKNFSNGLVLVNSLYANNEFKESFSIAEEVLQLQGITPDQQIEILHLQASNILKLKQYDLLDTLIERVNVVISDVKDNALKTPLYRTLGKLKISQFKIAQAQAFYLKAIEFSVDRSALADVYEELGISYAQQGKLAEAAESMLESIKIYQENNKPVPNSLYINLGGLSLYTQNWAQAVNYLLLAIKQIDGDTLHKSDAYSNLGNAYFYQGDKSKAFINYKRSLEISDALGVENSSARNNLAYLLMEKGDYQAALTSFKQLESLHVKNDDNEQLGVAKKNIGEAYVGLGKRKTATQYFEQAYNIYTDNKFIPKLLELYPVMIDNYEVLGDLSRALSLAREFKLTSDETINVESKAKIAELESAFELEKKNKALLVSEKAISDLAYQQTLNDRNLLELKVARQDQQYSIYLLVSVVAVLLLAGFFLIRINNIRAKTNSALLQKNEEIEKTQRELEQLNNKLAQQSLEDALTGLKNRRFLEQMMPREKARLQRELTNGNGNPSLVIMLDIDHFKNINDTYGHSVGDQVLKAFAEVMKVNARSSDMQVRWGGEEFLWYCPDTSFSDGALLCQRVSEHLATIQIEVGRDQVSPTCSFGYAAYPMFSGFSNHWELTIKAADAALYRAKALGRNRWIGSKVLASIDEDDSSSLDIDALLQAGKISFQ